MSEPLCLLVCDYYREEAERAAEGMEGVTVVAYPADCDRTCRVEQLNEALERCPPSTQGSAGEPGGALVIGSTCLRAAAADPALAERCDFHLYDHCQTLFQGEDLLHPLLDDGAHLVTPGMLRHWRRAADGWGFQDEQAKAFFADSIASMVLLDTGVDEAANARLEALADYVGRPAVRVSVGLDHFRLQLRTLVAERRLVRSVKARRDTERRLSEYAMIYDLIGRMTGLSEESRVIDNILELFTMLCAPSGLVYLPWDERGPREPVLGCGEVPGPVLAELTALGGEQGSFGEDGMALMIRRDGQTLGGIALHGLATPEHRRRYLNMAHSILPVLALAISNARAYEEIQRLNGELEGKVDSLDTLNRELDAFAYSVSHDLRAPLRVIDGYSRILVEEQQQGLSEQQLHYLDRVRANGVRMGELIDAILRLSRASRGEIVREPVDLSALAAEVVEALREKEPRRRVDVAIAEGLRAEGDARLLRVVFDNLLGNAWKYSAKREDARIEVGSNTRGGEREFYIRDNGAGFDMAYADKLFQPFQRLHTDGEFEGIGIGLSTVQRVCQRHGGTLRAEGVPGEGAVFFFTLPDEIRP